MADGVTATPEDPNRRPHCEKCGRFLRKATLRTVGSIESFYDDYYQTGDCPTHGRVEAVWERP